MRPWTRGRVLAPGASLICGSMSSVWNRRAAAARPSPITVCRLATWRRAWEAMATAVRNTAGSGRVNSSVGASATWKASTSTQKPLTAVPLALAGGCVLSPIAGFQIGLARLTQGHEVADLDAPADDLVVARYRALGGDQVRMGCSEAVAPRSLAAVG